MYTGNWEQMCDKSNYHFDWNRIEPSGYDYSWIGRFEGDWTEELKSVVKEAVPKTWRTRGKNMEEAQVLMEELDLLSAGMSKDTIMLRKHYDIAPIFQKMVDHIGLEDCSIVFHVQYPGEMLNLHVDKLYRKRYDSNTIKRFFIFLEDIKPGQFLQIGTNFIQWRAGDMVFFDWKNIPHASANAGWEPRPILVLTGIEADKTRDIMMSNHKVIKI